MKLLRLALILTMTASPTMAASNGDSSDEVAKFTNAITSAFIKVVDGGNTAWEHLAQGQAKDTLQTLATKTGDLTQKNNDLLAYIRSGNATDDTVSTRVKAIKTQLQAIKQLMGTFATELDEAAHPIGENLRTKIASAGTSRAMELDQVEFNFRQHDTQAAIQHLDVAIEDLGTMSAAIKCFQDSITNKKAACDPQTLKGNMRAE